MSGALTSIGTARRHRIRWISRAMLVVFTAMVLVACGRGGSSAGDGWEVVMSGLPAALTSVWGTSPSDIWAVGGDPENTGNTVMRFDGNEWRDIETGFTGDLWWVFGFEGGSVFMGGLNGLVLRYRDGSFERMDTPGDATVYGIWGVAEDDLWAVGGNVSSGAFAWRYDGAEWSHAEGFPPVLVRSSSLFKVWGAAADDVWLVGTGGLILHYDGSSITQVHSETSRDLFTVHGDGERVAAVGGFGTGVIVANAGDGWQDVTPAAAPHLVGIWLGPQGSYAVGVEGAVYALDDQGAWGSTEAGVRLRGALHSVWVDSQGGVWSVGGQVLAPPLVDGIMIYKSPPAGGS